MAGLIPDAAPETVAEQIVGRLITSIKAMTRSDDGSPLFKDVRRGDPDEEASNNVLTVPACYVEDSNDEIINTQTTQLVVSRELSIIVHVRFMRGQQGVDPYKVFQYYRGLLSAMLLRPEFIRPLGTDMYEVGYSPEIFQSVSMQGGTIVLRARYRHERFDPYTPR